MTTMTPNETSPDQAVEAVARAIAECDRPSNVSIEAWWMWRGADFMEKARAAIAAIPTPPADTAVPTTDAMLDDLSLCETDTHLAYYWRHQAQKARDERDALQAHASPREWQDIATAALQAVNMSAVSIDPETFEHGFHVDWSAIKLVMAALANVEVGHASPRELPTSYAHWQQMRGMLADKVDWALNTYDDFNGDDAYPTQWILDRIVDGLRETRTALELG